MMSIRSLSFLSAFLFSFVICGAQTDTAKTIASPASLSNADAENIIFEKVEIESSFDGGAQSWRRFLEKNLSAAVPVDNGAPSGRYTVWVQFIVDKTGEPTEIKALTSLGYGMEEEVIRIIKKSKWVPALQRGRLVKSYKKQPVTFLVEDESIQITTKTPWILYTNTSNLVTVKAYKVKDEDLGITVSKGTVTKAGDGNFIVKVTEPGRVVIDVMNMKKEKKVGSASFEVVNK